MSNQERTDPVYLELPDLHGNYVLVYHNDCSFEIDHKTLGIHHLDVGWYYYCGSAHGYGGLRSRILRHLASDKKGQWHVDHLKRYLEIEQVWFDLDESNQECMITKTILSAKGARIPIKGFGASDCHVGCPAHLVSFDQVVNPDLVFKTLAKAGLKMTKKSLFTDIMCKCSYNPIQPIQE